VSLSGISLTEAKHALLTREVFFLVAGHSFADAERRTGFQYERQFTAPFMYTSVVAIVTCKFSLLFVVVYLNQAFWQFFLENDYKPAFRVRVLTAATTT
jgi:hypothetical protein